MKREPRMTRRGLAALAAAAAGLAPQARAGQAPAGNAGAGGAQARLQRAATAVDRCKVPRGVQPAVQFVS